MVRPVAEQQLTLPTAHLAQLTVIPALSSLRAKAGLNPEKLVSKLVCGGKVRARGSDASVAMVHINYTTPSGLSTHS